MMGWISVLALAAAFQAPDAAPAARPATPLAAAEADWARRPTEADLARFYPERATQAKLGGDVTLACNVAKAGALSDCVVFRENPARYGFGEAALKIADAYGLRPERGGLDGVEPQGAGPGPLPDGGRRQSAAAGLRTPRWADADAGASADVSV